MQQSYSCCWKRAVSGVDESRQMLPLEVEELATDAEHRSAGVVAAHATKMMHRRSCLMYSISDFPATCADGQQPVGKPRACHVPPNAPRGIPIETPGFIGEVLMMHAPDEPPAAGFEVAADVPAFSEYFQGRHRRWEFRIQGRFRRRPEGNLYFGIALRDFNYNQAVARSSLAVKRLGLMFIKWKVHMAWGDRCESALQRDAELSHLVTDLTGFDQIIVTPEGEPPPPITARLEGLGFERAVLGYKSYKQEADSLSRAISLSDTYTFCFWGPSRNVDLLRWQFNFGATIPMDRFFQEWPLHFVLYELDERPLESKQPNTSSNGARHLESRKRYYLDIMGWSTKVDCSHLAQKYTFLDAPGGIEEEMAAEMAASGTAGGGDCRPFNFSKAQTPQGTNKGSRDCLAKTQWMVPPLLSVRFVHLFALFALLWSAFWPGVHGVTVSQ